MYLDIVDAFVVSSTVIVTKVYFLPCITKDGGRGTNSKRRLKGRLLTRVVSFFPSSAGVLVLVVLTVRVAVFAANSLAAVRASMRS